MEQDQDLKINKFLRVVIVTVFALIAIGAIVRSTGAGMGCPDWPKCFGMYIPPTSIDQLPADYKTKFAVAGRIVADFSVVKTWTEYLNRLFGVWTGIATLILSFLSLKYYKSRKSVFWLAQLSLFLVVMNGWLGSIVVKTHLMPGVITAHMLLAIFLVFTLLQLRQVLDPVRGIQVVTSLGEKVKKYKSITLVLLVLLMVQVILGTQVREQIDHITNKTPDLAKSLWLSKLDFKFLVHRSYSALLLVIYLVLCRKVVETLRECDSTQILVRKIALCLFGEIAAGVAMSYFNFPAFAQPLHLLLSVLLAAYTYELWLSLKSTEARSNV